jgi:hypothetical protein
MPATIVIQTTTGRVIIDISGRESTAIPQVGQPSLRRIRSAADRLVDERRRDALLDGVWTAGIVRHLREDADAAAIRRSTLS